MDTFLQEGLTRLEASIRAFEDAILQLSTNADVKSYQIDTAQTQQRVTHNDLDRLRLALDGMYAQRAVYRARLGIEPGTSYGEGH